MTALVEGLVLVGGFLAFAAFGYYAISKLGDFLDNNRAYIDADYAQPNEQEDLNIAATSFWAIQAGVNVLKDMKTRHPDLRCTFSLGEETELLHALDNGNVDIVIMPAKVENNKTIQQRKVIVQVQPFVNEDGITIVPASTDIQHQVIAWENQSCNPFVKEFVEMFCRREV